MRHWPNAALVAIFIAVALVITGCQQRPRSEYAEAIDRSDTSRPRGGIKETLTGGVSVYKDSETGCEYLLYYSDGITPRMEKQNSRKTPQRQRGCYK